MNTLKYFGYFVLSFVFLMLLSLSMGWFHVFETRTVGKAQQNAQREVFEETQSFVESKRQEALKWYKEYQDNPENRAAIEEMVAHSFANFDENLLQGPVRDFVYKCKY